ncbi:tonB-system energizer ExbB [Methylobacterium sp. W2]|uniref:tonB-system energizer ExbB n=1 Tax=Methylobacterium sp. W2 TaxID=2598107 RepID=UPI001D0CAF75|nr:tonB-system energizer ExbB [Methylobacterium sp. W2]MCC0808479.1 tonB-system energizer ExbB [Methylobacterium sp. W2]
MPISKRANPNGPESTVVRSILRIAAVVLLVSGVGLAPVLTPALAQDVRPVGTAEAPAVSSGPAIPVATMEPAVPVAPEAAPAALSSGPVAVAGEAPASAKAVPVKQKSHDLSPMGMFWNADPVVKAVMISLALASVATWTILFSKIVGLVLAKRRLNRAVASIRTAASLSEACTRVHRGVGLRLLVETEEELGLSQGLPSEGIKERVAIALHRVEVAESKSMASGTGILASIGSIGPFVGLFGTVWGIMGSFIGIANSNTTNLAVVAPGIAEALLATGIGLVAAIPAVVIYNALTRSIGGYRTRMGDAVALIMRHLSRDLDRRESGLYQNRHAGVRLAAE